MHILVRGCICGVYGVLSRMRFYVLPIACLFCLFVCLFGLWGVCECAIQCEIGGWLAVTTARKFMDDGW